MARTAIKNPKQVEKYWRENKWRQTVLLIRKDAYEHGLRLETIIEKWLNCERMSGTLTADLIRDIVFYRTGQWITEHDLPDGDEGFV